MSGRNHNFVHCLYRIEKNIYTYIYYIYAYHQHDRSLTAPSYREKWCHFPPVSELLGGWVQHFCCYTLALQRILVVWKKQPKTPMLDWNSLDVYFQWGRGLVRGTKVGRCLFGWALCACIKSEDPYESTRILWDVQVRQLVAGADMAQAPSSCISLYKQR